MGLSQTCTQIRSEFHAQCLSRVPVTICYLDHFLLTFFPKAPGLNTLRLLLVDCGHDSSSIYNLTRVIELKNRLPNTKFEVRAGYPRVLFDVLASSVQLFLNNRHPSWLELLRSDAISSVRIHTYVRPEIKVMFKNNKAPLWIKSSPNSIPHAYFTSLGLNEIGAYIQFGVTP
ncbi:unnamed protein product [Periconia digitata]|uniref:Uncharacterized protein n=1 Tax=Periconia digitata TaxID=1303443 RepID=A0A9W4UKC6_9PLEO|nr:unnamed protein product [Periconia digitata]